MVYVINDQKVMESLNAIFDDVKLLSIKKEDSSNSLDIEDHSDDKDEPEVVLDGDDNDKDPENGNDSDSDIGNAGHTEAATETMCEREKSVYQESNNSVGI